MAKLLFFITSHKNPGQVVRLVHALKQSCPDAAILIHHDPAGDPLDQTSLSQFQDVYCLSNPIRVGWGEFSVVESELRGIEWLMQTGLDFDWLVLLSGQDYPLRPLAELQNYLETTSCDGFLEYFPISNPPDTIWNWNAHSGIERYHYYYLTVNPALKALFFKLYRLVNWQPWLRVKAGRFGAKLAFKRRQSIFSNTFVCYAGSQWHTLNRRCIQYVYDFIQSQPKIVDYYRHTMVPDESFFQTVLVNNSDLKLCNDNLRYIAWEPPYPAIMQSQDRNRLMTSGKFFARKFDITVDADIFDRLDDHLGITPQSLVSQ